MEDALVRVVDLCKVYNPGENEVRALDHVNLEIHKGEFVAIIGQSGSGKSTFMNMLGCLDVPTSGKYYLNGTDVSTMKDNDLSVVRNKEIGFIFQGFNLIANLTALENVELPLIYRGIDRKTRRKLAVESLKKVRGAAAACGDCQSYRSQAAGDPGRRTNGKSGLCIQQRNYGNPEGNAQIRRNLDPDHS